MNIASQILGSLLENKLLKMVPPLKEYPEEIESESSVNSDRTY